MAKSGKEAWKRGCEDRQKPKGPQVWLVAAMAETYYLLFGEYIHQSLWHLQYNQRTMYTHDLCISTTSVDKLFAQNIFFSECTPPIVFSLAE